MTPAPSRILAGALCAGALVLSGCFRIGVTVGPEIPQRAVERIVAGETTKEDVLKWFGAPAEATDGEIFARLFDAGEVSAEDLVALPFSDMLVYEITEGQGRILLTFVFNWMDVRITRDRLMVFFDEDDVVLYYGLTRQRVPDGDAATPAVSAPEGNAQMPRVRRGPGKR